MGIFNHVAYVMLLGIPAMVLHECGHVAVAMLFGVKVKRVGVCSKGFYTVREPGPNWINIAVSAAGPLVNLALAFMLWNSMKTFAEVNVIACLYNLLPIPNSDGSRILQLLRATGVLPHPISHIGADV